MIHDSLQECIVHSHHVNQLQRNEFNLVYSIFRKSTIFNESIRGNAFAKTKYEIEAISDSGNYFTIAKSNCQNKMILNLI